MHLLHFQKSFIFQPHRRRFAVLITFFAAQFFVSGDRGYARDLKPVHSPISKFKACVIKEIDAVIDQASEEALNVYGDPIAIENTIIEICDKKLPKETQKDNYYTDDPYYMFLNSELQKRNKKMAERDKILSEARIKKEDEDKSKALDIYIDCAKANSLKIASLTDEPAEVIVSAAFASCSEAREAAKALYKVDERTFKVNVDDIIRQKIILVVIEARASPKEAPASKSPKNRAETPI